ncbi:hypothetical protein IAI18_08910 [Acetobacteraceae bacterium H6797]|nr:hypothetical protein [Acetobacteraceae bacterium H6797]
MKRLTLALPLLALLSACASGPRDPADAQREAACRAEAERVMRLQDPGQAMRDDEAESRQGMLGTQNRSISTGVLSQRFALQRQTEDCVRANRPAPQPVTGTRGS